MKTILFILSMFCVVGFAQELKVLKQIEILDGDTISYIENGVRKRVRLYRIDAPEISSSKELEGQQHGNESKYCLKYLLHNKKVEMSVIGLDRYKREIGILYTKEGCVNTNMLLKGAAWYYPDTRPVSNILKHHEIYARDKKVGMWKLENNIEPWLWRKDKK